MSRARGAVVMTVLLSLLGCGDDAGPEGMQGSGGSDPVGADGGTGDAAPPNTGGMLDASSERDGALPDAGGSDARVPQCSEDDDCDDGDLCSGMERCVSQVCTAGGPLDCAAPDACHTAVCDPTLGCAYPLIDGDGDGHAATSLGACGTDCNDGDAAIHPGATEVTGDAADADEDCNGGPACFVDADGDGYRIATVVASADADCSDVGEARASIPTTDCQDGDPAVFPGATEAAGDAADADENCDGTVTCFVNVDGDGYRTSSVITSADADCSDSGEARAALPATDCSDGDPAVNPGATEVCGNTADENCSGTTNELAECFITCDWSGARWLSHGVDGGGYTATGAWVSCISGRISNVEFVGTSTFTPSASGTTDLLVGCNWSGARWASQGVDGGSAILYGATVTCNGTRVTAMSWEMNTVTPTTATAGDLSCNWSGARFLSHGIDGACAFQTGFNVTCQSSRITHVEWIEGCTRLR